jgi:hypothetical protein
VTSNYQNADEAIGIILGRLLPSMVQNDRPATTVPDAVLNRTQCVVVIQAGTTRLRPGNAACRETSDRWNSPILVTFEEAARSNLAATLLIFISKDAAVKALRSGSLEIATYNDPVAPIAPKNAIPSEHELNRDLFTYEYTRGPRVMTPEKLPKRSLSSEVRSA